MPAEIRIPLDAWDDDSEGAVSSWYYADGESVSAGAVVCEIMNEKVASELTTSLPGVLRILVAAELPVLKGQVVAIIE